MIVKSLIIKRSIVLEHQRTSVSLEDAFWSALRQIAAERREALPQLIASISANRQSARFDCTFSGITRIRMLDNTHCSSKEHGRANIGG